MARGAGAGKPPRGGGGDAAPDRAAARRDQRPTRRRTRRYSSAKETAEAASRAKSRYVVGISHELRSPLNAILGYAQLLEKDADIPVRKREGLRIIRRSGEHLTALIGGLLDISKIEAGHIELYRDEIRLPEFLDHLVQMMRLQAETKGIALHYRAEALPRLVYADEHRMRQVLINLLSNAIKFTSQGSVTFTVRYRSQVADFKIIDTGRGIADADLARIFEPFQRAGRPVRARHRARAHHRAAAHRG